MVLKIILLLVALICGAVTVAAQEPVATPSPVPPVAPAKRDLIRQILDLTNSRKSTEAMFSAQFDEMERQMPEIQWQAISSLDEFKKLTAAQQANIKTKVSESSAQLAQRIKELFLQRIDMKQMVEEISYTMYDKHFSEGELRDLVAFYQSETGKKVVAEMPALYAEAIAKAGELISPKVKEIVEQSQQEQTAKLELEIQQLVKTPAKPPAKKPVSRKRSPH
jgi:uncharacterized protein